MYTRVTLELVEEDDRLLRHLGADFRIFLGYGDPRVDYQVVENSANMLGMVLHHAYMLLDTLRTHSYIILQ